MWTADDKFFEATLATKLGIASPKTLVLPNKDYVPGIVPTESLRNLIFPLDWQGDHGLRGPALHPEGRARRRLEGSLRLPLLDELIHHYDNSGLLTMIVQEFIDWEHFVRCICLGQQDVMPIKYDPSERKYHHVEHHT